MRLLVLLQRVGIGRLLGRERVDAFGNDVHFQMGSGHAGLYARRGLLLLVSLASASAAASATASTALASATASTSGLLDDSLDDGLLDRLRDSTSAGSCDASDSSATGSSADGLLGDELLGRARPRGSPRRPARRLGALLGGLGVCSSGCSVGLVGHQASISICCGFWAACGWSGA